MDGLIEENRTKLTYLSIINGLFTLRVDEHQKDKSGNQITEERTYEDQHGQKRTVIERMFKGVEGKIQEAKIENSDYGAKIVLIIKKGTNTMHISFKAESSYGRSFLFRAKNIDYKKTVTLKPYNFDQKDDDGNIILNKNNKPKRVIGITVLQEGCGWEKDKVPALWNSESPELPSWEKKTVMGKDKWNNDKQMEFLGNNFQEWADSIDKSDSEEEPSALDIAKDKIENVINEPVQSAKPQQPSLEDMPDDDLPF